jgi:hypothetical protein
MFGLKNLAHEKHASVGHSDQCAACAIETFIAWANKQGVDDSPAASTISLPLEGRTPCNECMPIWMVTSSHCSPCAWEYQVGMLEAALAALHANCWPGHYVLTQVLYLHHHKKIQHGYLGSTPARTTSLLLQYAIIHNASTHCSCCSH